MNIVNKKSTVSERDYHKMKELLSYSQIKCFIKSRKDFYKKFVLDIDIPDEEASSPAMISGSILDCLITDRENFENRFVVATCLPPVGQILDLTNNLFTISKRSIDNQGVQQRKFEDMFEEAFKFTKFDFTGKEITFKGKDKDKALELFMEVDKKGLCGQMYYKELMGNIGKTVITLSEQTNAERNEEELRAHPVIGTILNRLSTKDFEVLYQFPVFYKFLDFDMKSLVDILHIDHDKKTIQPYDIKNCYDPDTFTWLAYLGLHYYIQAATYDTALKLWQDEKGYSNYEVLPMKFIVCDSIGASTPLLYELEEKDLYYAYQGFKIEKKSYVGLIPALEQLRHHITTGDWKQSKYAFDCEGRIKINLNYK